MKIIGTIAVAVLLTGCGTVSGVNQGLAGAAGGATTPLGDGNTNFSVQEAVLGEGFQLSINYLHPQPNASSQAILSGCRQALAIDTQVSLRKGKRPPKCGNIVASKPIKRSSVPHMISAATPCVSCRKVPDRAGCAIKASRPWCFLIK